MNNNGRVRPLMFVVATLIGLLAGGAIVERNMQTAQAASREQGLAAIQAARGAMDIMKADMERAGYAETRPNSKTVAVQVDHSDPLKISKAFGQILAFKTPAGEDIVYGYDNGKLVRNSPGESQVLLENAQDFKVQASNEGDTINLAFWIPVGDPSGKLSGTMSNAKASQAPAYAHFVKCAQDQVQK